MPTTRGKAMATIRERSVLSGMLVNETMRRQVVQLPSDQTLAKAINHLIRFKAGALLVTDGDGKPAGVVSKKTSWAHFTLVYRSRCPLQKS